MELIEKKELKIITINFKIELIAPSTKIEGE